MTLLTKTHIGGGSGGGELTLVWYGSMLLKRKRTGAGLIGPSHMFSIATLCGKVVVPEIRCHLTPPAPAPPPCRLHGSLC